VQKSMHYSGPTLSTYRIRISTEIGVHLEKKSLVFGFGLAVIDLNGPHKSGFWRVACGFGRDMEV